MTLILKDFHFDEKTVKQLEYRHGLFYVSLKLVFKDDKEVKK